MLFDLRGKRKRVVQVVYAGLAAIFLVGFVGLGIGVGNGTGGILDAIGLGGSGGSSTASQFEDQIDEANDQLAKNPDDPDALLKLAKNAYLTGKAGVTVDESGIPSVSDDAHTNLGTSVDAWEKYLRVNKGKPNPSVAAQIVQAYYLLNDVGGAAEAQQIVAEDQPSSGQYNQLAFYRYYSADIAGGDKAAKKAVSLTPGSTRKATKQQLDQLREQAVKAKKQAAKQQKSSTNPGASPLQNPLGGVAPTP